MLRKLNSNSAHSIERLELQCEVLGMLLFALILLILLTYTLDEPRSQEVSGHS